jgi:hypothetical protein
VRSFPSATAAVATADALTDALAEGVTGAEEVDTSADGAAGIAAEAVGAVVEAGIDTTDDTIALPFTAPEPAELSAKRVPSVMRRASAIEGSAGS